MKIAIAVGIILNAGVLSVIAYQQNQQTAEQGSQVVALLKQLEKPESAQEPEENPLAGKIDKLVALAERTEQRELSVVNKQTDHGKQILDFLGRAEQREIETAKANRGGGDGKKNIEWEYGYLYWTAVGRKDYLQWEETNSPSIAVDGQGFYAACIALINRSNVFTVPQGGNTKEFSRATLYGVFGSVGWELVQYRSFVDGGGFSNIETIFKRKRIARP